MVEAGRSELARRGGGWRCEAAARVGFRERGARGSGGAYI